MRTDFFDNNQGFSTKLDEVINKLIDLQKTILETDTILQVGEDFFHTKNIRKSEVPGEIGNALYVLNRKKGLCSPNDLRRINHIARHLKWFKPFDVPEAVSPSLHPPLTNSLLSQSAHPVKPPFLEFDFDFSYYAYSQTLRNLLLIVSKNPKWLKEKMPLGKKEELIQLQNDIKTEISSLRAIKDSKKDQKEKELRMIEKLLSVFDGSCTNIIEQELSSLDTQLFELRVE